MSTKEDQNKALEEVLFGDIQLEKGMKYLDLPDTNDKLRNGRRAVRGFFKLFLRIHFLIHMEVRNGEEKSILLKMNVVCSKEKLSFRDTKPIF